MTRTAFFHAAKPFQKTHALRNRDGIRTWRLGFLLASCSFLRCGQHMPLVFPNAILPKLMTNGGANVLLAAGKSTEDAPQRSWLTANADESCSDVAFASRWPAIGLLANPFAVPAAALHF